MRVDVTTTYSLKDDAGREVTRITSKAISMGITLDETDEVLTRKVNATANRASKPAATALRSFLRALTS